MDIGFYVKSFLTAIVVIGRNYTMHKFAHNRVNKDTKSVVLSQNQKNEIKNYFSDYGKVTWKFHNYYTEKTGNYYVNYIPDDMYFNKINRYYNDYQLAKVIDHKCFYANLFQGFKQPEKLADRKGEYWFVGNQVMPFEKILDILCEEPAVFVKAATLSVGGHGVKYISKETNKNYRREIEDVISKITGDIIVQKPVIQHKELGKLNESSVNTIRILTMLRNNEVKIYSSVIRIGNAGSKVDNSSSGGVSVGITEDGRLKEYAYFYNGDRNIKHPSSGVVFKDYQLPSFDKVQEMVKKAHLFVPHFKMISWDISIGEDCEPILIEANLTDGGINFHQLNNGPLFGDDTKEILDEVFGK